MRIERIEDGRARMSRRLAGGMLAASAMLVLPGMVVACSGGRGAASSGGSALSGRFGCSVSLGRGWLGAASQAYRANRCETAAPGAYSSRNCIRRADGW